LGSEDWEGKIRRIDGEGKRKSRRGWGDKYPDRI
jgi:hypothetical protein